MENSTEIIGTIVIPITKASVLSGIGTDKIQLRMGFEQSPFPEDVQNYGVIQIETTKNWGVKYCKEVLGIDPELIICG